MNAAHLHLIICHIPLVGSGFTLMLFFFSMLWKNKEMKRASLWFAFITGISALLVYLTGDGAEETLTATVKGITENMIEPHETFAMYFMIALVTIGAIAGIGLVISRASAKLLNRIFIVVFILLLSSLYLAVRTGETGGRIRHTTEVGK